MFQRLSTYVENECFMEENESSDNSDRVLASTNVLNIFVLLLRYMGLKKDF